MTSYNHYYSVIGEEGKLVVLREGENCMCSFYGPLKKATGDFQSISIVEMLLKAKAVSQNDVDFEYSRSEVIHDE